MRISCCLVGYSSHAPSPLNCSHLYYSNTERTYQLFNRLQYQRHSLHTVGNTRFRRVSLKWQQTHTGEGREAWGQTGRMVYILQRYKLNRASPGLVDKKKRIFSTYTLRQPGLVGCMVSQEMLLQGRHPHEVVSLLHDTHSHTPLLQH